LPISKSKNDISEQTIVESMHYCIQKSTLKLYDKNEQNTVIWLSF